MNDVFDFDIAAECDPIAQLPNGIYWGIVATAGVLIRENPDVLRIYFPDTEPPIDEIEELLINAFVRMCENPHMSKNEIIGCLCPGEECTPKEINAHAKIPWDSGSGGCECVACQEDCSICLTPFNTGPSIKTSCHHRFHKNCWEKILPIDKDSISCPLCRNLVSGWTYKNAREAFLKFSSCTCCENHKRRRPTEFFPGAKYVDDYNQCSDPKARTIWQLIFNKKNDTRYVCQCSCRAMTRKLCRMV